MSRFPADDRDLADALGIKPEWHVLWLGTDPAEPIAGQVVVFDEPSSLLSQLPFADNQFDFAICRGMLQKANDPFLLCSELTRVARCGFLEVPNALSEWLFGSPDDRWICDESEEGLVLRPKPYVRHPLGNIGRKLLLADEPFRERIEQANRSLFHLQMQWENELTCQIWREAKQDASTTTYDPKDPVHCCVAWLDLALNCMSFELPGLDDVICSSLTHANELFPDHPIVVAASELQQHRDTGNKEFYRRLVQSLRKQDLEELVRKGGKRTGSRGDHNASSKFHYELLREYFRQGVDYPLVSVVIRTFNRPQLLERCLRSLNEQMYPAIEVILVNDGGEEIGDLRRFCKFPCHTIRHADNKGKAAALNTGLRMARGVYVNILDDDDVVYPDHIALLVEALEHSGSRVAYADSLLSIESEWEGEWRSVSRKLLYAQPHNPDLLLQINYLPVLCVLFERSLVEQCGYADERLEVLEDWDLWIRFAEVTSFYHLHQITSEYTQRADGDNATQKLAPTFEQARNRIGQKVADRIRKDVDVPELLYMPKRYRTRLLSLVLDADAPEQIREAVEGFTRELQDVLWAELVIVHRLSEEELEPLRRELEWAADGRVRFISHDEVKESSSFYLQFDYVCESDFFDHFPQRLKQHPLFGNFYRMQKKQPLLSLVVLTKNQLAYTQLCVESILRHTRLPYELILVDNGSTDGTRAYFNQLTATHRHIKLVSNVDNKGYGGGNNQGIAVSTGDWVAVLNNDIIVTKDWIEGMLQASRGNPRCGIVGPVSNYVPPPQQIVDPLYAVDQLEAYAREHRAKYAGQTLQADRVIGFCMLVKREVIDAVGGFDLRYEIGNFEDDDFCIRAWLAGYDCFIASDVFIHHFGSTTFKNEKNIDYELVYHANCARFIEKWKLALPQDGVYRGWKREELGVRVFDPVLHYAPLIPDRSVTSYLQLSRDLFERKHFHECETVLLQGLDVHGEQQVLRYNLLVNAMQTRNQAMAEACFKHLDERMIDVGYLKIIWHVWEGQQEEARQLAERLMNRYPDHPQLLAANKYVDESARSGQ